MEQTPDVLYVLNIRMPNVSSIPQLSSPIPPLEYLSVLWSPRRKDWYKHHPEAVIETENVAILWYNGIQAYRKIKANKPDIIKGKKRLSSRV